MIENTEEYKEKLKEFDSITDRAICIFLSKEDKPLCERLEVLNYDEATTREERGQGTIILVNFNNSSIKVYNNTCQTCGVTPCDCHWGDY